MEKKSLLEDMLPLLSPKNRILIELATGKRISFDSLKSVGWGDSFTVSDEMLHIVMCRIRGDVRRVGLELVSESNEGTRRRAYFLAKKG